MDSTQIISFCVQATEPYSVKKVDRSNGGKMARKSFGFPHKKSTEKRRMQVETKQLKGAMSAGEHAL